MKQFSTKLFISLTTIMAPCAFCQVNSSALGARLGGGNFGSGIEVSYQHGIADANRLEADVGWSTASNHNSLGIALIYQWIWNIKSGFNRYVGPGASLGIHAKENHNTYDDGIGIGVGGQIGIEHDFQKLGAPILLAVDVRPLWNVGGYHGFGGNGALSVRYIFGSSGDLMENVDFIQILDTGFL